MQKEIQIARRDLLKAMAAFGASAMFMGCSKAHGLSVSPVLVCRTRWARDLPICELGPAIPRRLT
jgi:hypothetical protein